MVVFHKLPRVDGPCQGLGDEGSRYHKMICWIVEMASRWFRTARHRVPE